MRFQPLSVEQKNDLELCHRYEAYAPLYDRIKTVLLKSDRWKNKAFAQALRNHDETVRQHLKDCSTEKKLKLKIGFSR